MNAPAGTQHLLETEIKLLVRDPEDLKRRLRKLGFRRVKARHFERNVVFDFPDRRLRKAGCLLRLRFAGRRSLLTFKARSVRSEPYKVRREIETGVEDGPGLRTMLGKLGLREAFGYEKYRTVYAPGGTRREPAPFHLFYDETPIGNYLELEGPERWIDRVARRLGYSGEDYITASYGALYWRACRAKGERPGNMVFPAHKS